MLMNESRTGALSRAQLILLLLAAAAIGVALTFLIILPTEQKLERAEDQAAATSSTLSTPATPSLAMNLLYIGIDPSTTPAVVNEFGEAQPVMDGRNIRQHDQPYRQETIEIELGLDESVEYKAIMEQGEVLLYHWQASGDVYFDFHAHQEAGDPDFFTRYTAGEGQQDKGSIVALYQGQHGWFWLNISDGPVKVSLTVAGYYSELIEIDLEAEQ